MFVLRPEPGMFDLPAWEQRLAELRADPPSGYRDDLIVLAEARIRVLGGDPLKIATEAS